MDQTVAAGDSLLSGYTDMLASTQNMMSQSTAFQSDMNNMKMAFDAEMGLLNMQSSIGEKLSSTFDQQAQKLSS